MLILRVPLFCCAVFSMAALVSISSALLTGSLKGHQTSVDPQRSNSFVLSVV